MEVSRRQLLQLGFGVESAFRPAVPWDLFSEGSEHRGLMDTAWDWEADILECTSVDVLGNDMLTVC